MNEQEQTNNAETIEPGYLEETKEDTAVEPATKTSKRGQHPRSIEELEKVAVSKMTPAEIQKYVAHLRDENVVLHNQMKTLQDSFTGIQKQKRELEIAYNQLAVAAKTQIQFCKDTIAQAHKTLIYMQPLEVE